MWNITYYVHGRTELSNELWDGDGSTYDERRYSSALGRPGCRANGLTLSEPWTGRAQAPATVILVQTRNDEGRCRWEVVSKETANLEAGSWYGEHEVAR